MNKVILVEDEELLRKELSLTTPWQKWGYTLVGQAENGIEGLALIQELKPDLIITDIRMPGMDGLMMLEELHKNGGSGYSPAVLILTGHSDFEYARKALRLGVNDYLLKPIDDQQLENSLRRLSGRKKAQIIMSADPAESLGEFPGPHIGEPGERYVLSAINYIEKNYSKDISISDAAGSLNITESYLSRLFKQFSGCTFLEYLTNYRIKTALVLMKNENLRIKEVASRTGFRDAGYFSQIFRKHTGVSPVQYRNSCFEISGDN